MHTRLITAAIKPGKFEEFPKAFNDAVLPEVSQKHGFKGLYMLKDTAQSRIITLVLWETEADALASAEGFQRRQQSLADYLAGPPNVETMEVILRA
ncbi:MAG: antibiotic biosynthesis monooxygenase family protein [Anaerolineales bacterium]